MKNFKEQFNKIKFLITLIIGIALMLFVNGTHKMSAGAGYAILFLATLMSIHQFKMAFDKKYNEKKTKFINERNQLPWHKRNRYLIFGALLGILLSKLLRNYN